jgi:hypothetical protein
MLFPPAQVAFVYLTTLLFSTESTAYSVSAFFHLILGMLAPSLTIALRFQENFYMLGIVLHHIFSLVPTFSSVWGLTIVAK